MNESGCGIGRMITQIAHLLRNDYFRQYLFVGLLCLAINCYITLDGYTFDNNIGVRAIFRYILEYLAVDSFSDLAGTLHLGTCIGCMETKCFLLTTVPEYFLFRIYHFPISSQNID